MTLSKKTIKGSAVTGFFICFALLAACLNPQKKYIVSENKFVAVLVDIHIADGIAMENLNPTLGNAIDSASLYNSVFSKHKITRAQFDSSLIYFASKPEEFQKIYDKVNAKLKMMELEAQEKVQSRADSMYIRK
jgi:hypothetical protein